MSAADIGFFKDDEFIIKDMRPIRPLENYLWSEHVVGHADQTGQGTSFACIDSNRRTLVKSKRIFYLKDRETKEIYSPNRNFTNIKFDVYECHVGLGYQTIVSEYKGIKTEMTIIIPKNDYVECVRFRVVNNSKSTFEADSYYYCDLEANITEHLAYGKGLFDKDFNGLLYPHDFFNSPNDYNLMFAKSNLPLKGFAVSNQDFFGLYGNEVFPDGIKKEKLPSIGTVFEAMYCSAMQFEISLKPNEEINILFVCGIERDKQTALDVSAKYLSLDSYLLELNNIIKCNNSYKNTFICETPDDYFNVMTNVWLKRQLSLGKTWGRVYGKGFRDVLQDIAAFVSLDSSLAKKQIINVLSHQYESGNAIRMFEPDMEYPYMDMPSWIAATILQYIKETGDLTILEEPVGYLNSDLIESIFEHLTRGINFLINNRGEHNLVLWGGGDWNDSMNNAGMKMKGESVWLSIATVKSINEYIEILRLLDSRLEVISVYERKKEELIKAINKYGWENDHYIYGYDDTGEKVGSDENEYGKIYLNPQTWAVLSKIKTGEEADSLMNTVENRLQCDFGYLQNVPSYQKGIYKLGRSTYFVPGLIENGSVYNHGVAFKIVADCMLGRTDNAYKTFNKMRYDNPLNKNNGVEPYAFSNMYIGPDSPFKKGFAPMCWITGTAGWMYRAFTENIVGIQPEFNGLAIRPNIPSTWNHLKVSRIFRDATYNFEIIRNNKNSIIMDGKIIKGNILPLLKKGQVSNIVVYVK